MRKLVVISILICCIQFNSAQKNDTIYYDVNWKGVSTKEFASYFYVLNESQKDQPTKEYYITGELYLEGIIPVNIDKNDANKSKFKGHLIGYYKSGKKKAEYYSNDSCKYEGTYTSYYESGIRESKGTFKNGKLDGTYYYFYENGNGYIEIEMKDGVYKNDYAISVIDGKRIKVKIPKK